MVMLAGRTDEGRARRTGTQAPHWVSLLATLLENRTETLPLNIHSGESSVCRCPPSSPCASAVIFLMLLLVLPPSRSTDFLVPPPPSVSAQYSRIVACQNAGFGELRLTSFGSLGICKSGVARYSLHVGLARHGLEVGITTVPPSPLDTLV